MCSLPFPSQCLEVLKCKVANVYQWTGSQFATDRDSNAAVESSRRDGVLRLRLLKPVIVVELRI